MIWLIYYIYVYYEHCCQTVVLILTEKSGPIKYVITWRVPHVHWEDAGTCVWPALELQQLYHLMNVVNLLKEWMIMNKSQLNRYITEVLLRVFLKLPQLSSLSFSGVSILVSHPMDTPLFLDIYSSAVCK